MSILRHRFSNNGGGGRPESPTSLILQKCVFAVFVKVCVLDVRHPFRSHWESFRENLLIKSQNQNIFEKFKLNRNLQTIPFKMIYNMSMLRHWFSNERWGGGRPESPTSLIL